MPEAVTEADQGYRPTVIAAQGAVLDRALDVACPTFGAGLNREAYGKFCAARMKTSWGGRYQRTFALIDGGDIVASAEQYDLTGVLDGRVVGVCGIGPVHSEVTGRAGCHAHRLVETLVGNAARDGAEMALLFPQTANDEVRAEFDTIHFTDLTLDVAQSPRHGAPMTMVRAGEERDLAAIVAMGRTRAEPFRFRLDRDVDFLQYAITTKRLLAGLRPANARQLHFYIAEEGITAAAYVILSVVGEAWTLEECGDRDPSGARVGALLQALIAREPVEQRPTIRAWLPRGFLPPQVTIASSAPSSETIGIRMLGSHAPPLRGEDVLFWRNDLF
jgi:hypothetical protein